jgi:hypothetical protein
MRDEIVEKVVDKMYERSQFGITHYGTTLEKNNTDNFFNHALEESMDLSLYLMKIMDVVKSTPNDQELGAKIRQMVM